MADLLEVKEIKSLTGNSPVLIGGPMCEIELNFGHPFGAHKPHVECALLSYLVSSNTRTRIKKTSDILFGNTNIILHLKFHLLNSSILHWGINGLTFTWSSLPVYYYGIFFSPNFMISFLSLEL